MYNAYHAGKIIKEAGKDYVATTSTVNNETVLKIVFNSFINYFINFFTWIAIFFFNWI